MSVSRRDFLKMGSLALALPGATATRAFALDSGEAGYRADLLPTKQEVWEWELFLNKLGPTYTGNPAHTKFVEFLASELKSAGLDVARDHYTFTRWDARRFELAAGPRGGSAPRIAVSSYYPYSGETPASGVSADLVHAGVIPNVKYDVVGGKIAFVECPIEPRAFPFTLWGAHDASARLPEPFVSAITQLSAMGSLEKFREAGAIGVVLGWMNASEDNANYQYIPFGRPLQHIPGLWVGRESALALRQLAAKGARATLTLEADVVPNTPTDTLLATLPGTSDEVVIVNTHTDGPNSTEENGGIGVLALAKYFAQLPRTSRRRTMVFLMATGHFAAEVPSADGVVQKHPDLIKKTAVALTVEHLGAMEWRDDESLHYRATGKPVLSYAITPYKATSAAMVESLQGSRDTNAVVVKPGPFFGEGGALNRAGIPTIGYIPLPEYLCAAPPDGCLSRLNADLMHSQIEVFAKVLHKLDRMSAAQIKDQ
jgi:hypothetical protein